MIFSRFLDIIKSSEFNLASQKSFLSYPSQYFHHSLPRHSVYFQLHNRAARFQSYQNHLYIFRNSFSRYKIKCTLNLLVQTAESLHAKDIGLVWDDSKTTLTLQIGFLYTRHNLCSKLYAACDEQNSIDIWSIIIMIRV